MRFLFKQKNNKAFVLLFAITITSIILAVSLSVANIAFNEARFSTSTRDADDALFAADHGAEAILLLDKNPANFPPTPGGIQPATRIIYGIGGRGTSCAIVTITKDNTAPPAIRTTIISKGYNVGDSSCVSSNPNRVERELDVYY